MTDYISPRHAWELQQSEGARIVDLRHQHDFAQGHPKGAISLPYSEKSLALRLSFVLVDKQVVIMLAASRHESQHAVAQLQAGSYPVAGLIKGGFDAWRAAELPIQQLNEVSIHDLLDPADRETLMLDVREPMEWEVGCVPGALLISLGELHQQFSQLPQHKPIVVICEGGVRSATAASVLLSNGYTDVSNVPEGMSGYRRTDLPLEYRVIESQESP